MGDEGSIFSEAKWGVEKKSDVKERKTTGWRKVIPQLFCCVRTAVLFFRRGLASSFVWPAAIGGSGVACNHCYFEAKDKTLLYYLLLLMRKPEFWHPPFVTKVEQISPVSVRKKDSLNLSFFIHRFFYLWTPLKSCFSHSSSVASILVWSATLVHTETTTDGLPKSCWHFFSPPFLDSYWMDYREVLKTFTFPTGWGVIILVIPDFSSCSVIILLFFLQ